MLFRFCKRRIWTVWVLLPLVIVVLAQICKAKVNLHVYTITLRIASECALVFSMWSLGVANELHSLYSITTFCVKLGCR